VGPILRVASYNLRDLLDDADAAARVVRAVGPDVLCLQEVPRHVLSSSRIASFAARCGLYWSGDHRGGGGTTVMTSARTDVRDAQHRPLRVARLQRVRGYAVSHVRLPGLPTVTVVSLHLGLDAVERAAHAATVLRALHAAEPLVLAGDLNEGPEGQAWAAIARRLPVASAQAPTFPASSPRHRLDVVFASPALPVAANGTGATGGTVELDPADLVAATDHLPVWVDLDLSGLVSG
jgi:endonuclease/exonuclease/phosphatase family metal-dependent hydrolase